jgi:hypothetical protein
LLLIYDETKNDTMKITYWRIRLKSPRNFWAQLPSPFLSNVGGLISNFVYKLFKASYVGELPNTQLELQQIFSPLIHVRGQKVYSLKFLCDIVL